MFPIFKSPKKNFIAVIIIITIFIFIGSIWLFIDHPTKCLCGGCCAPCYGDCDYLMGFPFTHYYQGENMFTGFVSEINFRALAVNVIVWCFLILLSYLLILKRDKNKFKKIFLWVVFILIIILFLSSFVQLIINIFKPDVPKRFILISLAYTSVLGLIAKIIGNKLGLFNKRKKNIEAGENRDET